MLYLIMLLYFCFTAGGLILMKLGVDGVKLSITSKFFSLSLTWQYLIGVLFYILSFILFTVLISKMKLGNIYSISVGVVYILVMLLSWLILKEKMTVHSIIGALLVLIGIVIMNWRK